MKLRVLIFFIFFTFVWGESMSLPELFKKGLYLQICHKRWDYINKYANKREDLLSMVAYSCIKKGDIIPALDVAKVLKTTPKGRTNAVYITTLFFMKTLILKYMFDDFDIKSIKLPEIKDNLLGIVFADLTSKKVQKEHNRVIIFDKNKKFVLSLTKTSDLAIKIYKNNKFIKEEKFW